MKNSSGWTINLVATLLVLACCLPAVGCSASEPTREIVLRDGKAITFFLGERETTIKNKAIVDFFLEKVGQAAVSSTPKAYQDSGMYVDFGTSSTPNPLPLFVQENDVFVEFSDGWYQVPYEFYDLLGHIDRDSEKPLNVNEVALLSSEKWIPLYHVAEHEATIPSEIGANTPAGLYWAVVGEYSRLLGIDLAAHSGEKVTVDCLVVIGVTPDGESSQEQPKRMERAYVVRRGDQMLGAWIGDIRDGFTIDRRSFRAVFGKSADAWLDARVDNQSLLSPEDIVRAFFSLIAKRDYAGAARLGSSGFTLDWMLQDAGEESLYRHDFRPFPEGSRVELLGLREYTPSDVDTGERTSFLVTFNLWTPPGSQNNVDAGVNECFFTLIRVGQGWKLRLISNGV